MAATDNWHSILEKVIEALRVETAITVLQAELTASELKDPDWAWVAEDAGDYDMVLDEGMRRFYGAVRSVYVRWRFADSPEDSVDGTIDFGDLLLDVCMSGYGESAIETMMGPRNDAERALLRRIRHIGTRSAMGDHWLAFRVEPGEVPTLWYRDPAGAGIDLRLDLDFESLARHWMGTRGVHGWPLLFADVSEASEPQARDLAFSVKHLGRGLNRLAELQSTRSDARGYLDRLATVAARLEERRGKKRPKKKKAAAPSRKLPKAEPFLPGRVIRRAAEDEREAARRAERWVVRAWPKASAPQLLVGVDPCNWENDRTWQKDELDDFVDTVRTADLVVLDDAAALSEALGIDGGSTTIVNLAPPGGRFELADGRSLKATYEALAKASTGGSPATRASLKRLLGQRRATNMESLAAYYWYGVLHGAVRGSLRGKSVMVPVDFRLPGDPAALQLLEDAAEDRALVRVNVAGVGTRVGRVMQVAEYEVVLDLVQWSDGDWVSKGPERFWIGELSLVGPIDAKELRPWMAGYYF